MSTNYYLHKPSTTQCEHCGHDPESEANITHIGKSSFGWCFMLHIHPQVGVNNLGDWEKLWVLPGATIKDEYGETISIQDMMSTITTRSPGNWSPEGVQPKRCKLDEYCVAHGDGSWDHMVGDFC